MSETGRHGRSVRRVLTGALVAATALALGGAAAASAQVDFGVRGGVYTDESDPFVGAEVLWRLGATRWFLNPNFEWVFVDNGDLFTLNADAHYDLPVDAPVYVWLGGGLAILVEDRDRPGGDDDDETDAGVNLLAGVGFLKGQPVRPYVQGKLILSDESQGVLAFGVRF